MLTLNKLTMIMSRFHLRFILVMTILGSINIIMGEVDSWNDNWYDKSSCL